MSQSTPQTNACPGVPAALLAPSDITFFDDNDYKEHYLYIDIYHKDISEVPPNWKTRFISAFNDACNLYCVITTPELMFWMKNFNERFSYRFIYRGAYTKNLKEQKEFWYHVTGHDNMRYVASILQCDKSKFSNVQYLPIDNAFALKKKYNPEMYLLRNIDKRNAFYIEDFRGKHHDWLDHKDFLEKKVVKFEILKVRPCYYALLSNIMNQFVCDDIATKFIPKFAVPFADPKCGKTHYRIHKLNSSYCNVGHCPIFYYRRNPELKPPLYIPYKYTSQDQDAWKLGNAVRKNKMITQ